LEEEYLEGRAIEWESGDRMQQVAKGHLNDACVFVKRLRANANPLGRGKDYPNSPAIGFTDEQLKDKIYSRDAFIKAEEWISILTKQGKFFTLKRMLEEGEDGHCYWPIPEMEGICSDYLKTPHFQCQQVDLIVIRLLIYKTIRDFGEYVKTARFPRRSRFFSKPSNNSYLQKCSRMEWTVAIRNSIQFWIAVALGAGASVTTVWWAGPPVWLATLNMFTIRLNFKHRQDELIIQKLGTKLLEAHQVFETAQGSFVSSAYLKRRLTEVECAELHFPPVVFLLLDTAIERSGLAWGEREGYDYLEIAQHTD